MNGDPLRKLNILDTISIPLYMSVKRFKSFFMNWSWKLKQHLLLLDSAACECLYAWTKRANCFPMEARVTQSDPTQALTLSNQTLHCKVHGQTRTRWWCPGTALLPKCPGCEAQQPGASRCRQRRSVLHDQVVLSVGSRLPACQGLLPPRATSPSGCGPCADTLVRPTKTEFAANTGTRVAPHQGPAALMYGGVPPGRGQRTGGLQQQLGPALQQRGTSCHHRQTTLGPAADSWF